MNRKGLAEAAAAQAGVSVAAADAVLSAALDAVVAELAAGGSVVLPGFGTFEARDRAARQGRNPRTGEPMQIAASRVPAFKAGQAFRRAISV